MANAATAFGPCLTQLTGNVSGNVESLPRVTQNGGRERVAYDTLALAAQASGTVIGMLRLPVGSAITGVQIITDTSLGTATLAIGDVNTTNLYASAQTYTAVNTSTRTANRSAYGQPITSGYDSFTGLPSNSYEDITLTVGAAALPASGNLFFCVEYAID